MTNEQIKHMVGRFLSWKLPADFSPDCGVSFSPEYNRSYNEHHGLPPSRHEPVGTNLLTASQAEAMVRYMLDGLPETVSERELHTRSAIAAAMITGETR